MVNLANKLKHVLKKKIPAYIRRGCPTSLGQVYRKGQRRFLIVTLEVELNIKSTRASPGKGVHQWLLIWIKCLGFNTTELHCLQIGERVSLHIYLLEDHLT